MSVDNEELLAYLKVKSAFQSKVIPNQEKITFISNETGIPQAWTLNEIGEPVPFGQFEDRIMDVYHSPSGKQSLVGMDCEGNEKQQLYLLTNPLEEADSLVYNPDHFHNFGGWSPNGNQISYSSNRRQPGYFDVFIMDVETKDVKQIFTYDGNCKPLDWLPDGENILISIDETNIENALYILNIESGKTTKIGKTDVLATYPAIALTKDGRGAYLLTNMDEETVYLSKFTFDQPNHIEKVFHIPEWDIEELKLSPDEKQLAFTINEGGRSRLAKYDLVSKQISYPDNIPAGVIESLSWMNTDTLIFTLKTPTMPGDIWSYTIETDNVQRLTQISHSNIEDQWIEPTLCSFKSFDGLDVPYFLYQKEKGTGKPAVIYVHGGPESQIRAEYNPVVQYLAHKGFAVATPNVRGSKGYGRTYIKLDDGRKRMDPVEDLACLAEDLTTTHGVDSNKIGVMGRSYGGFMVLAALTHYPHLWNAAVDIVGISHFTTFLQNTGPWRRHLRECEYGTLEHDTDFFEEISPLNHSAKIQAPLLVFHGRNDTRVPVSEAQQLVSDMQDRGQVVEFTIFEDEGHHTEKLENIITMHSKTVKFFQQFL